jgi:hypothetical protein
MSVSITNTDANISGKTLVVAENAQTITGLQTFDRDPSAPFAVSASSAVVTNLDSDKWDGKNYTDGSWTPALTFGGGTTGITYSLQEGFYRKLGEMNIITCRIVLTSKGSSTGSATITGVNVAAVVPQVGSTINFTVAGASVGFHPFAAITTSTINLMYHNTSSSASAALTDASFANNTALEFTIVYIASS